MKIQVLSSIHETMARIGMLALAVTVSACVVGQPDDGGAEAMAIEAPATQAQAQAEEQTPSGIPVECTDGSQHPVCLSACGDELYYCQQYCTDGSSSNVGRCLSRCDQDYNVCLNYCDYICSSL